MPKFSKLSLQRLEECHLPLQILMRKAILVGPDFTILCGYRDEEEQNEAYKSGHSKLKYPKSKHNTQPAQAVDIAPYPIDWTDRERFIKLSKIIKETWNSMSEFEKGDWELSWGGDWKKFPDLPHWELNKK